MCSMALSASGAQAAIYLRVSLDATGEQLAIARQRADCAEILQARGWALAAEFVDNSISASDARKHRPGYNALVEAYQAGQFTALACWDLDRLTRQPRQLEDWIEAAEKDGLLLVTANGEADLGTDGGRLFARVKLAVARSEVERKSTRQRRAAQQRADLGRPPLGVRLTGYTPTGDVVPTEAEMVQAIYARFVAGASLYGISRWLHDEGHETRHGRPWHPSTIRTILMNPRYAGLAVYQGEMTGGRGKWEPLVDETTWRIVHQRLEDPGRRRQEGTDRKHLGSGIYLCDRCRRRVRATSGTVPGKVRYGCGDRCCIRTGQPIDDLVLTTITRRLALPDVAGLLPGRTAQAAADIMARVDELNGRLAVVEHDYDAGFIDGRRYAAARERVSAELDDQQRRLAALTRRDGLASIITAPSPAAAFAAADLMVTRAVVDELLEVRLCPQPRGRRGFDPASVVITWRVDGAGSPTG